MSVSRVIQMRYGDNLKQEETVSAGAETIVSESIPDASINLEVTFAADVSAMKGLYIQSDQDLTIETNSGSTPTDTLALKANTPVVWSSNSVHSNPLTADVTANIFVTNSSGSAAALEIRKLEDPTP